MTLNIGNNIKNLRNRNKITQDQLATYLGVTPQAISRWETGDGYPDIEFLPSLAEFFSVSADDLLGINLNEKEKRLKEIMEEVNYKSQMGVSREDIPWARQILAEFPSNVRLQLNLGKCLFWAQDENDPNSAELKEAEKIFLSVSENAESTDHRTQALVWLCNLYSNGLKDAVEFNNTVELLPTIYNCREKIKYDLCENDTKETQNYIRCLADLLGITLKRYTAYRINNDRSKWDEKIAVFEWIIDMYKMIFGDDLLFYNLRVAELYRYIATYKVAQKKYDETLDCLEKMCNHIEKFEVSSDAYYNSPFADNITYQTGSIAHWVHNDAWEVLNDKFPQERYDPIREDARFVAIENRLKKIAK